MANRTAVAASRAALLGASGLVIPSGGTVETRGFLTEGDGGGGLYKEVSAPATPLQTNPGYMHIAGDRWFKLVPQGGTVKIHQFGGRNDSTLAGTTGTDNLQPFYDACRFDTWGVNADSQRSHTVELGSGHLFFSDGIELHVAARIKGVGVGYEGGSSTFCHFPANKTLLIVGNNITIGETAFNGVSRGEAAFTTIENVVLCGKATSTDHARAGVHIRAMCHMRGVGVMNASGDGFRIKGSTSTGTIADFCSLYQCGVNGFTRDGLYIDGNDANVCHISHFSVHGGTSQAGCGINDAAAFGNKYDNIHIAGYGRHGVRHNGRIYYLITYGGEKMPTPGPGPGEQTVPGTNDEIWYDFGDFNEEQAATDTYYDTLYPPWTATPAEPYRPQIPVLTNGASHVFDNLYVEGDTPCHMPNATIAIGGTFQATKYSNKMYGDTAGVKCNQGFGSNRTWLPGQTGYAENGAWSDVILGPQLPAGFEPNKGMCIFYHDRGSDWAFGDARYMFRYYDKDVQYARINSKPILHVTMPGTDKTFGRNVTQPDLMVFRDFALREPADYTATGGRIFGVRSAAPTTGYHSQGEFFFNDTPTAGGTFGWSCVASGTPGTWKAIPVPA